MFCSVHIQRNVYARYNKDVSTKITKIAKLFSVPTVDKLLEEIGQVSKNAENYIRNIDPIHWRSSEWIKNDTLPPRYGVYTTNTSESLNSMLLDPLLRLSVV
jgi:transposase-like protein